MNWNERASLDHIQTGSKPGKLPVIARGHACDRLELPTKGRLIAKTAIKGDLPKRIISISQPIGSRLYPDPRQKLPGGHLQERTHKAFKTAEREIRLRNQFPNPIRTERTRIQASSMPASLRLGIDFLCNLKHTVNTLRLTLVLA